MNLNPAALTPQQLVSVLNKSGGKLTEAALKRDIAEGAPVNADGTLHLVHYAAWLAEQVD